MRDCRFLIVLLMVILTFPQKALAASDWAEEGQPPTFSVTHRPDIPDELTETDPLASFPQSLPQTNGPPFPHPNPESFPPPNLASFPRPNPASFPAPNVASLPHPNLASFSQAESLHLTFIEAIDAMELEVFSKQSSGDVSSRLNALEKAVFGTEQPELTNFIAREERLLKELSFSPSSVTRAAKNANSQSANLPRTKSGLFALPGESSRGIKRVLTSPTFWTLVGLAGAAFAVFEMSRQGWSPGYGATPGYTNPNYHLVQAHYQNGVWIPAHYQTNPNGTMADNWSSIGNTNPFTGQAGTIYPSY
jgi:hypothetical protein